MVSKTEMQGWMKLAAVIVASGYKENDKRFLEGDCKWWHDLLVDGLRDWNRQTDEKSCRLC